MMSESGTITIASIGPGEFQEFDMVICCACGEFTKADDAITLDWHPTRENGLWSRIASALWGWKKEVHVWVCYHCVNEKRMKYGIEIGWAEGDS